VLKINISNNGKHWDKKVSIFGIPIYHRHDYTAEPERKTVGFNCLPSDLVEIDDDCFPEEKQHKNQNK